MTNKDGGEGGLIIFPPLKRGGGGVIREGGLNRGFTVLVRARTRASYIKTLNYICVFKGKSGIVPQFSADDSSPWLTGTKRSVRIR